MRERLGDLLRTSPGEVPLAVGPDGKPELRSAQAMPDLRFNVAHSDRRGLVAVAFGREVGVDVERVREDLDLESIARRAMSPREREAWMQLHPSQRVEAFFAAWARKEAYVKGRGGGLGLGMERVEPAARTGGRWHLDPDSDAPAWSVADVDAGPGYAAAVAAEGADWELRVEREG